MKCANVPDSIIPCISVKRLRYPVSPPMLKQLSCLQERVFERPRHNRISEIQEIIACSDNTAAMLLAVHGTFVCGFVHVRQSRNRDEWMVRGVGVDRAYRRLGIACLLLESAVLFTHGIKHAARLVSYVDKKNARSLRLHEKAGFRIDEARFGQNWSELRYRMVWRAFDG